MGALDKAKAWGVTGFTAARHPIQFYRGWKFRRNTGKKSKGIGGVLPGDGRPYSAFEFSTR